MLDVSSAWLGVGGVSVELFYHAERERSIEPSRVHRANLVPSPLERLAAKLSPRSDRLSPVLSHDSPGVGINPPG